MISLLGALLGFLSSLAPTVLKLYQDKQDKQHELKLLELQMQAQAQLHTEKMEEIGAQADIEESKALYEFLNLKNPDGFLLMLLLLWLLLL